MELETSSSLVLIESRTSLRTTRQSSSWEHTSVLWMALRDSQADSCSLSSQRQTTAAGTRMPVQCFRSRSSTSSCQRWSIPWTTLNRIGWPTRTKSALRLHQSGPHKVKGSPLTTEDCRITYNYMLVIDTIRKRNQSMIEFLAGEVVCKALLDLFDLVNFSLYIVYCRLEHSSDWRRFRFTTASDWETTSSDPQSRTK